MTKKERAKLRTKAITGMGVRDPKKYITGTSVAELIALLDDADRAEEERDSWIRREHEARVMAGECTLCPHLGRGDPLVDPGAKERGLLQAVVRYVRQYLNPPAKVNVTYDPPSLRRKMKRALDHYDEWKKKNS